MWLDGDPPPSSNKMGEDERGDDTWVKVEDGRSKAPQRCHNRQKNEPIKSELWALEELSALRFFFFIGVMKAEIGCHQ